MSRTWSSFKALLLALALLVGVAMTPDAALADKLHLKDGRVLEGAVVREVEGYIWFKFKIGGLESEQMFNPGEISKLERETPGDAVPAAAAAAATAAAKERKNAPANSGAPRVAIISLGEGGDKDMVGVYMTAEQLRRMIPVLQAENVDTVVFRINSGGGLGLEVQRLSDVIHDEFKPKFRVVAWIESAISAAAMTAHCIEEIYFMRTANYGACTGWFGALQAVEGRQLEEYLYAMEKISAKGGYSPYIMRAMQVEDPLSCTIDANGDVHWYLNESGQYLVNPKGRILTFNSQDAVKYRFARGLADTYQELGKAMGFNEVHWVGKTIPGVPYPVCRAEEDNRKFRKQVYEDERRTNEYFIQYQTAYQMAAAAPADERGKFIAKARENLNLIRRMVNNNPNFALLILNILPEKFKDWVEEREEELRRLARR